MAIAPLSILILVAQALPGAEMTFAEFSAVAWALLCLTLVGLWVRWRSGKGM